MSSSGSGSGSGSEEDTTLKEKSKELYEQAEVLVSRDEPFLVYVGAKFKLMV